MGLSGRKIKQRIPNDPRNLSWADDAARFGSNYLSKFGWDSSKGLGVGEEGRTTHIKVAQKLDMMGIGAAHQKDPNGIAWKQNKDFENLLKRLNQANGSEDSEDSGEGTGEAGIVVDGFVKPKEEVVEKKKEKKDKREKVEDAGGKERKKKRKRDEEGEGTEKKSKKKRKKSDDEDSSQCNAEPVEPTKPKTTTPEPEPITEQKTTRVVPRHRSHRARHIAAKTLASKSAIAISEILGIAPTPSLSSSNTPSGTQTPQEGKLTSIYDDDNIEVDKITTSTKSLQDYFKEKMGKLKGLSVPIRAQPEAEEVDYEDEPRGGLGSRPKQITEDDAPRLGLSKFSSLISSSFLAATSLSSTFAAAKTEQSLPIEDEAPEPEKEDAEDTEDTDEEERQRKKEKKEKKERKRQEKARKRNEEEGQGRKKGEKKARAV